MQQTMFYFGVPIGAVAIASAIISIELGVASIWLGYLVMLLAFSTIFVALERQRQLRPQEWGFLPGLITGLAITLVAGVVYVAIWESYLAVTDYRYIADAQAMMRDHGASVAEIQGFMDWYATPGRRMLVTFFEIFPPGVLVSLVVAFAKRSAPS